MKNLLLLISMLIFLSGCKKDNSSLIGSSMTITRNGTTAQFEEVNIFSPDGNGLNDYFFGPMTYCQADSNDQIVNCHLKITGPNISRDLGNVNTNYYPSGWDGKINNSPVSEGVYSYEADYTTINGTAKVTGSVRVWRNANVQCAEKSLYRFMRSYNANCIYDSLLFNENIPCH